jgi:tetratricopeptide (TPR) repeat protein/transglutaminase-like putative cysteine protease
VRSLRIAFVALALLGAPAPALRAGQAPDAVAASGQKPPGARLERLEVSDRIEADGTYVRRQRSVAHLTDAAGVANYSQVGVPFLESNQEAELTLLVVTKPDGRELDLLASAPRDVAPVYPADLPIYSDLRVLRAAVPSLEPGDRIAFETTVRIRPLAPGEVWTEVRLYPADKADAQTYELDVPESMALVVHVREGLEATSEEERGAGRWIRRWRVAGRPAPAEGAAEGSGDDADLDGVEPDVVATSFASWDEFGRWWASLGPSEVDDAVHAKAKLLVGETKDPRERLRALHRYVAQEIRYLALPLGLGRYRARPPAEVMRTGLGDCKDKIRLLASLAASVGLEVDPVLVGVTRRRRVDAAPSPDPFDHVVARARLGGEEIWMDPTSEMTAMGSLPRPVRGLPGVAVDGAGPSARAELVTTPDRLPVEASRTVETVGAIDLSGVIRARVRWTFAGDDERERLAFRYANAEQRRQVIEFLGDDWEGDQGRIGEFEIGEPGDADTPFWVDYEAEWKMSPQVWAKAWDLWIPMPAVVLDAPPDEKEDPAAARRELELTAMPRQRITAHIEVPEGVKVTPPVPVTAVRDFAEYRSDYRVDGRTLVLSRELVLKAKEVPPAKFAELEALRDLIRDDRQQEFDFAAAPALAPAEAENADQLGRRCFEVLEEERYEEAEGLCRRAIELDPKHRWSWNNLGRALFGLGRVDEAEAAHRRQIEIAPDDAWSYANLGRIAFARGDAAEGERLLRRQIDVAPLEAFAYRELGAFLAFRGKLDEAELQFARALKLDPEDERTRRSLAGVRAMLGRCDDAFAQLGADTDSLKERAATAAPLLLADCGPLGPHEAWFEQLRIDAENALSEIGLAEAGKEALAAVGALVTAWDAAGRIALERGDAQAAAPWFAAALPLSPNAALAAKRAEALRAIGDAEGAKLHFAISAALGGMGGSAARARLEREIPAAAERSRFEARATEESWRLRSLIRTIPATAGASGVVWILFEPDGRVRAARADSGLGQRELLEGLGQAPVLPLPKGNRARIPRRADVSCDAGGRCTFLFEWPAQTFRSLAGEH